MSSANIIGFNKLKEDVRSSTQTRKISSPGMELCSTPHVVFVNLRGRFRRGRGGGGGGGRRGFFAITCFFCDHFEELQTVSIEVKLIINNAPLTYVYPNTIKTYFTPDHLLFGRRLLCYSNTASTGVRNLTVLRSTIDKIDRISNHF